METLRPNAKRNPKRFLAVYVFTIALPSAIFLYLGGNAVYRQWGYLESRFTHASVQEAGREAADAIEEESVQLALGFFEDTALNGLRGQSASSASASCGDFRTALEDARTRHPVVRDTFVVCNGKVRFPLARAPAVLSDSSYIKRYDRNGIAVLRLLAQGDSYRKNTQLNRALASYNQAYDRADSGQVKALLLLRMARALEALRLPQSKDAFGKIANVYGDLYDPSGVPFAIVAALARRDGSEELARTRNDLVSGRWSLLSADQTRELLRRYESRLGPIPSAASSPFLRTAALANSLQAAMQQGNNLFRSPVLRQSRAPRAGDVYLLTLRTSDETSQAFFTVVGAKNGDEILLGFTADLDWLQRNVLPRYLGYRFDLGYKGSAAPTSTRIAFSRLFPDWELVPASSLTQDRAGVLDWFLITGAAVLLCLMLIGISVLLRHFASEQRLMRVRTDFISGVSHELKTPISIMRLYAETLIEDESLTREARDCCALICEEAERLTHLVDDILHFSPVERGMKRYTLLPGDLTLAVRPALLTCKAYLERKGITLTLRLNSALPEVDFDAEAVKSALINLVDNAVKYSGTSKIIEVESYYDDDFVVLAVTDHGIGVAAREQKRIFEPYYRVDTGFSRGGCGLGLFLVKHVMEGHRGKVELITEMGLGSSFRLLFPRAALAQPAGAAPPEPAIVVS